MFGTLHWKSHDEEAEFVKALHGASNPEKNSACDRCRAKKVKCNVNGDDCSRCKRLGKTCTFSSTKRRGDQKIQKESINIAQQEHSLDLLDQSSASSSSKDPRHEERVYLDKWPERVYVDKWPLASSVLADNNVDDSERGQQLLAELLAGRSAANLPNFDQSFLAEYGQQASDQDGDNIFNLALSPSPSFSTNLSSTHPEPIQPAAARTSENSLPPSLSSRDEITDCLPPTDLDFMSSLYDSPTRQSQDSSLLEIGSNATPTSLHASTLVSTTISSQHPSGQLCQCLATVVFAVEEFEASCNSGNRAELDSIVAYQKEAIKCCRSMLQCSICMAKRENLVLLIFVTEKVVLACGRIVGFYGMRDSETQTGSAPSSSLGCLATDRLSHRVNVDDHNLAKSSSSKIDCAHSSSITSTRTSSLPGWRELLLGDYEISSLLEWEHLVGILIRLQLRAVMALLADMENMGSNVLGETLVASLAQAKVRVGEFEKDIHIV